MADIINALFECFGFVAVGLSCLRALRDKRVAGVSWLTVAFFTSWGFWNVYYYPSLGQSWSALGAMATCAANVCWLGLLIYFSRKERNNE